MAEQGLRRTGNSLGIALAAMVLLSRLSSIAIGWVSAGQEAPANGAASWLPGLLGLVGTAVVFLLPLPLVMRLEKDGRLAIPLTKGAAPVWVLLPVFLVLAVVLNSLTTLLRTLAAFVLNTTIMPAALPDGTLERVIYFLGVCLFAPVLEELFFRGALQGGLRRFGLWVSMLVTAAAFALMHASVWEFPSVFILGLALCYVREITHSVRPCIVLHFANNLLGFILLLQNDNPDAIAGMATVLWVILLLIVLSLGALWAIRTFRLGRAVLAPFLAKPDAQATQKSRELLAAPGFWGGCIVLVANYVLNLFV